jgi:Sel1 repeat
MLFYRPRPTTRPLSTSSAAVPRAAWATRSALGLAPMLAGCVGLGEPRAPEIQAPMAAVAPAALETTEGVRIPEGSTCIQIDILPGSPGPAPACVAPETREEAREAAPAMAPRVCGPGHVVACTEQCARGNAWSCVVLGVMVVRGQGVPKDAARAADLFERACDADELAGCNNLGVAFSEAEGRPLDLPRALELFRQACYGGTKEGCTNIGELYESGRGVPRDYAAAAARYEQAVAPGRRWPAPSSGCCMRAAASGPPMAPSRSPSTSAPASTPITSSSSARAATPTGARPTALASRTGSARRETRTARRASSPKGARGASPAPATRPAPSAGRAPRPTTEHHLPTRVLQIVRTYARLPSNTAAISWIGAAPRSRSSTA